MKNISCQVHWFSERPDEKDDNDGYHYGIYTFDCKEEDFDEEVGYGGYDVLDVAWFKTEKERDEAFNK